MAETVSLTAPVVTTRTTIALERISIDVVGKMISFYWVDNTGAVGSAVYPTPAPSGSSQPTGAAMINTLNTANLTSNSLVKRILNRLQTDGYIGAGAVAGAPD